MGKGRMRMAHLASMARNQRCLAVLVVLSAVAAVTSQDTNGAPECPCITALSTSELAVVTAKGYPAGYGVGGCKKHDESLEVNGCNAAGAPSWCKSTWCYVDKSVCGYDAARCTAAGAVRGSTTSAHCHARPMQPSPTFTNTSLYYSYETCGGLNTYDANRVAGEIGGMVLRTAITTASFNRMTKGEVNPQRAQWKGWHGWMVDIVNSLIFTMEPPMNVDFVEPTWSTEQSRSLFSSSWTACVHDVALGRVDICVGDFWMTPQRLNMAQFLPPFSSDKFYLFVPGQTTAEDFGTILVKPFLPFSAELWAFVISFLIFAAIVMTVTDARNRDDYENGAALARISKSLYFSFSGYVTGGNVNSPASVPGRLAALGFGFFVLITLASYTANLATILVAKSSTQGIASVEDAINQGVTICIETAVSDMLLAAHPSMKHFVHGDNMGSMPAQLVKGTCGAMLLKEQTLQLLQQGLLARTDCEEVDKSDGKLKDEDRGCLRDKDGKKALETRDCGIVKVGPLVVSVPVSMPVSDHVMAGLSWGMVTLLEKGIPSTVIASYDDKAPPSVCGATGSDQQRDELSLPLESMIGTLFVSSTFQIIALILAVIEWLTRRPIQQLCGFPDSEEPEEEDVKKLSKVELESDLNVQPYALTGSCGLGQGSIGKLDQVLGQLGKLDQVLGQLDAVQAALAVSQSPAPSSGISDANTVAAPPPRRAHQTGITVNTSSSATLGHINFGGAS
uniref:Ionotropic glutamate receptor C-terminal domain-containing protein n=1 Tax=Hemiselmis tepida TaxID=464990 RepID=A0A7S0WG46_9CRYP|mmetsp:Transcript_558/g.1401  ORF Transcript_558/g.1401 Transcript_558/m.1401 type:complete len:734 (+) Transcript_558:205-2406(+)